MPKTNPLYIIILAAGKGTRMKASLSKVLYPIAGEPMIRYCLDIAASFGPRKAYVVLGHKIKDVRKYIKGSFTVIHQRRLRGTSDAVLQVLPRIKEKSADILVLCADTPLITRASISSLLKLHRGASSECTLLTSCVSDPYSYGRVIRGSDGSIIKIVEEKDADGEESKINEINTGVLVFKRGPLREAIVKVRSANKKREFYLTDIIRIFAEKGCAVNSLSCGQEEGMGVNSQEDLSKANQVIQRRILQAHMDKGVRIVSPPHTYINYNVKIGRDCVIYPFTVIENNVIIGDNCSIGPFCHLRESVKVENGVIIGNFTELVRTRVGKNTLIKHLSYMGDADIGSGVNIGAGSVIANFDGIRKSRTKIGNGAFIGSDSVLISPVEVGRGAVTGAGCVVTKGSRVAKNTVVAGTPARIIKKRGKKK